MAHETHVAELVLSDPGTVVADEEHCLGTIASLPDLDSRLRLLADVLHRIVEHRTPATRRRMGKQQDTGVVVGIAVVIAVVVFVRSPVDRLHRITGEGADKHARIGIKTGRYHGDGAAGRGC